MTKIDPKVEKEMLAYITGNFDKMLIPKYGAKPNIGICEFDLVKKYPHFSGDHIGEYLVDLKKKGRLDMVENRGGLRFYKPLKHE